MQEQSVRRLIAAGFQDTARAKRFLADSQLEAIPTEDLVEQMRCAPDPDQALLLLIRLAERAPEVLELFRKGQSAALPMLRLLGASQALSEFLIRHPQHVDLLIEGPRPFSDASEHRDPSAEELHARLASACTAEQPGTALRVAYRRELTRLALEDLIAEDPAEFQPRASRQLADLVGAAVEVALRIAHEELSRRRPEASEVELAVIGMGKCGARELNYVSDVDVIFVHRAPEGMEHDVAQTLAADLAVGISRIIGANSGE